MGSTVFIIPSDVIKSSGYRPQILYTSSGIINPVDPLASAYNLYLSTIITVTCCGEFILYYKENCFGSYTTPADKESSIYCVSNIIIMPHRRITY